MDEDDMRKFESELVWCIDQLRTGLSSGKLSEKQGKSNSPFADT